MSGVGDCSLLTSELVIQWINIFYHSNVVALLIFIRSTCESFTGGVCDAGFVYRHGSGFDVVECYRFGLH